MDRVKLLLFHGADIGTTDLSRAFNRSLDGRNIKISQSCVYVFLCLLDAAVKKPTTNTQLITIQLEEVIKCWSHKRNNFTKDLEYARSNNLVLKQENMKMHITPVLVCKYLSGFLLAAGGNLDGQYSPQTTYRQQLDNLLLPKDLEQLQASAGTIRTLHARGMDYPTIHQLWEHKVGLEDIKPFQHRITPNFLLKILAEGKQNCEGIRQKLEQGQESVKALFGGKLPKKVADLPTAPILPADASGYIASFLDLTTISRLDRVIRGALKNSGNNTPAL